MLPSPELSLRESLDGAIAYVLRKCSGNGKQELKRQCKGRKKAKSIPVKTVGQFYETRNTRV